MKKKLATLMTAGAALALGLPLCEAAFAVTIDIRPTKIRLSEP